MNKHLSLQFNKKIIVLNTKSDLCKQVPLCWKIFWTSLTALMIAIHVHSHKWQSLSNQVIFVFSFWFCKNLFCPHGYFAKWTLPAVFELLILMQITFFLREKLIFFGKGFQKWRPSSTQITLWFFSYSSKFYFVCENIFWMETDIIRIKAEIYKWLTNKCTD